MKLRACYADFHIHIGRTESNRPVKISASRELTFFHIVHEAANRKGMDMIGLIDCHVPEVQDEIQHYLDEGVLRRLPGGGFGYEDMCIIPGTEIELREPERRPFHVLVYFPELDLIRSWTEWMKPHMKNVSLSSQRLYVPARLVQEEVQKRGGLFIPAHVFTPFKSVYGSAADSLADLLDPTRINGIELGLSADTSMASSISELDRYPFLTNSDAHSIAKIAREYNRLWVQTPDFTEWKRSLAEQDGRRIDANFGLNPRLGKYHRTRCRDCSADVADGASARCPQCGSRHVTRGVEDRIREISDRTPSETPGKRPPYREQVPLEYIPGLGRRTLEQLLDHFGTEMNILHRVSCDEIASVAGDRIASFIADARAGKLTLAEGGAGRYGKVIVPDPG